MSPTHRSAYVTALGDQFDRLHPVLQQYFAPIPPGHVGIGHGTFDRVGTPKKWLWPVIYLLQRRSIIWAGWKQGVPFRVWNRSVGLARTGQREFLLPGKTWTMHDRVSSGPDGSVIDVLGKPGLLAVRFNISVQSGALQMTSTHVGLRLGRHMFTAPGWISPTATLTEEIDQDFGRQRVSAIINAPLVGRIYEYGGTFTYQVLPE